MFYDVTLGHVYKHSVDRADFTGKKKNKAGRQLGTKVTVAEGHMIFRRPSRPDGGVAAAFPAREGQPSNLVQTFLSSSG